MNGSSLLTSPYRPTRHFLTSRKTDQKVSKQCLLPSLVDLLRRAQSSTLTSLLLFSSPVILYTFFQTLSQSLPEAPDQRGASPKTSPPKQEVNKENCIK